MKFILQATGQFFEICAEFEQSSALKKELKHIKTIHQNEVKRIIQKHKEAKFWWQKKRSGKILITDIVPEFEPLKITITKTV